MNTKLIKQCDIVKIVGVNREFSQNECIPGTTTPKIGDVATVLEIYHNPMLGYELEACKDGETLWLASIDPGDLDMEKIGNLLTDKGV